MPQPAEITLMTKKMFDTKSAATDAGYNAYVQRLASVEAIAGLAPGDVSDATVTSLAANPQSALSVQLAKPREAGTDGQAAAKALAGAVTVVTSGHSQMYGLGGDKALPGLFGQPARSTNNPHDALKAVLNIMYPGAVSMIQRARSGELASGWLGWQGTGPDAVHGDIEFVWLDQNEAVQNTDPAADVVNFRKVLDTITRAGSQPVVIGGQFFPDRAYTHRWQAKAAIFRRVAERMGARYIDVAELQNTAPRPEDTVDASIDAYHFNDKGFALVGSRLAALAGPKGLNPYKVGPGSKVLPGAQVMMGGTVTAQGKVIGGKTIKLTAGQTLVLPLDVTAPCEALVRFVSNAGSGVGTGRIRYALSKAGIADRRVDIAGMDAQSTGITVRGHRYNTGPDLVFVTCDTGTLEVAGVEFTPTIPNLRHGAGGHGRVAKTALSGTVLGSSMGLAYSFATDESTPVTTLKPDGATATVRIDWYVTLAGGGGAGVQGVTLAAALNANQTWLGFSAGYAFMRDAGGPTLVVRKFASDGGTSNIHVANFFTGTDAWTGMISFVVTDGTGQLFMNNVAVGPSFPAEWKHYLAAAYSASGSPALIVHGCTIHAPDGCV